MKKEYALFMVDCFGYVEPSGESSKDRDIVFVRNFMDKEECLEFIKTEVSENAFRFGQEYDKYLLSPEDIIVVEVQKGSGIKEFSNIVKTIDQEDQIRAGKQDKEEEDSKDKTFEYERYLELKAKFEGK